jgi:hypothetical protein
MNNLKRESANNNGTRALKPRVWELGSSLPSSSSPLLSSFVVTHSCSIKEVRKLNSNFPLLLHSIPTRLSFSFYSITSKTTLIYVNSKVPFEVPGLRSLSLSASDSVLDLIRLCINWGLSQIQSESESGGNG